MSKTGQPQARTCGKLSCRKPAFVVVNHPEHGAIATCWACSRPYEVVGRV